MAKARMLHNKICRSGDVNKLPIAGRLLFTWLFSNADDDGRMKGDPDYVKVTVVPYTNWSNKTILSYLNQMKDIGLIYYWKVDDQWYIEFPKWKEHQYIQKDRYHPSLLPSYKKDNLYTTRIQPVYKPDTQSNISETNKIEANKSEDNIVNQKPVAVNNIRLINPKTFQPEDNGQLAAIDVWKLLEPNNPYAFNTTYLRAYHMGLSADVIRQFCSEIRQSKCDRPGAVFNSKVKDYLDKKASTNG